MSETVEIELLEIHNDFLTGNLWSLRGRKSRARFYLGIFSQKLRYGKMLRAEMAAE
jgi:hypothetical protein